MRSRSSRVGSVLAAVLLACACASKARPVPLESSPGDGLVVRGALPRTGSLSRAELASIANVEGRFGRPGSEHTFRGAPLDAVLTHMGFARGSMDPSLSKADKAPGWKLVVVATAADGFQAVFSCAELMPDMGPTRAFVAWEVDGAPVPADQGPLRLIVNTDRDGARSPWALRSIEVVDPRQGAVERAR